MLVQDESDKTVTSRGVNWGTHEVEDGLVEAGGAGAAGLCDGTMRNVPQAAHAPEDARLPRAVVSRQEDGGTLLEPEAQLLHQLDRRRPDRTTAPRVQAPDN